MTEDWIQYAHTNYTVTQSWPVLCE